ncbi:hypothetical protein [Sciscionella marina]|uniref:hypothetical protein n=1 Tax=Sciscionella marina TaxID=508770 RepID=UPI00036B0D50|nr:hypothetical protein [Sciscionella marina]
MSGGAPEELGSSLMAHSADLGINGTPFPGVHGAEIGMAAEPIGAAETAIIVRRTSARSQRA